MDPSKIRITLIVECTSVTPGVLGRKVVSMAPCPSDPPDTLVPLKRKLRLGPPCRLEVGLLGGLEEGARRLDEGARRLEEGARRLEEGARRHCSWRPGPSCLRKESPLGRDTPRPGPPGIHL